MPQSQLRSRSLHGNYERPLAYVRGFEAVNCKSERKNRIIVKSRRRSVFDRRSVKNVLERLHFAAIHGKLFGSRQRDLNLVARQNHSFEQFLPRRLGKYDAFDLKAERFQCFDNAVANACGIAVNFRALELLPELGCALALEGPANLVEAIASGYSTALSVDDRDDAPISLPAALLLSRTI
jgi:hypothetical protein